MKYNECLFLKFSSKFLQTAPPNPSDSFAPITAIDFGENKSFKFVF